MAQTDILARHVKIIEPNNVNLNSKNINFVIDNKEDMSVIDLPGVKMRIGIQIKKNAPSTDLLSAATETQCVPCQNFCHSIWSNVEVVLNQEDIVSSQDYMYGTRAYMSKLMEITPGQQELEFTRSGFMIEEGMHKDIGEAVRDAAATTLKVKAANFEPVQDEDTKMIHTSAVKANLSGKLQDLFFRTNAAGGTKTDGRTHYFEDHIYEAPFTTTNTALPYGIPLKVNFTRQNNKLYYLKGTNAANYEIDIRKFQLVVPYLRISAQKFKEIESKIQDPGKGVNIWLTRNIVSEKPIVEGRNNHMFNDLFPIGKVSVLPETFIFTVVHNDNMFGAADGYNHMYLHNNLQKFFCTLPGNLVVPPVENPDYDFTNGMSELAYGDFLDLLQVDRDGMGSPVTESIYRDCTGWFGVRLTPQTSRPETAQSTGMGDMSLTCRWAANPGASLTLLMIGTFKHKITITKNRKVVLSWR